MNREIIPKVKKIIGQSMIIAKEMDDVTIKPEHITLSILKDNSNKYLYKKKRKRPRVRRLVMTTSK